MQIFMYVCWRMKVPSTVSQRCYGAFSKCSLHPPTNAWRSFFLRNQNAQRAVVKVQGGFAGLAVTGGAVCAVVCVRQGDPAGSFGGANLHPLRVAGACQRARDGRRQRRQRDNPGRQPDEPAGKATRKAGAAVHERSCQAGSRGGQRAAARNAKNPFEFILWTQNEPPPDKDWPFERHQEIDVVAECKTWN